MSLAATYRPRAASLSVAILVWATSFSAGILLVTVPVVAQPAWSPTGGPVGGDVNAILAKPNGEILAGTDHGGVFLSADLGESWSRIDVTDPFETIRDFAANSQGYLFGAGTSGIRRSTDGGETWDLRTEGFVSPNMISIAINDADVIFAGSATTGIYRSDDNAETWTQINNGLGGMGILGLAIGPDGSVYGATNDGIFVSSDEGGTWTDITQNLPIRNIRSVFVDDEGVVWTGANRLSRKVDAASDWEETDVRTVYAIDTTSAGTLIGGACEIIAYSQDGESWGQVGVEPRPFLCVNDFATVGNATFAATSPRGVFRSDNDGAGWQPVNNGLDASHVQVLLATETLVIAGSPQGILRSEDGGATWTRHIDGLSRVNIQALLMASDGILLAGTSFVSHGLHHSLDGGMTWALFDANFAGRALSIAEAPNGDLFAGGLGLVFRSLRGSAPWDTVDSGFENSVVSALGVSPTGVVFAGASTGIRRSSDGGDSWEDFDRGLPESPYVSDFEFLPGGDVLVSGSSGVYRLNSGNDTWERIGPDPARQVNDIAIDSEGTLYAATVGGGVSSSSDEGATWTTLDQGLNNLDVRALGLTFKADKGSISGPEILYAGTRGGGVSVIDALVTSVRVEGPGSANGIRIGSNYPNPFFGTTHVPLVLDRPEPVSVALFDLLGRMVIREHLGRLPAGEHVLDVDAGGLATGIYLCTVDVGGASFRQLMTLTR